MVISGYGDSGWAGDIATRKGTSGGVCMIRPKKMKIWPSMQKVFVLSSAVAELYAFLKCSCQVLGLMSFVEAFGVSLHSDASAALAIAQGQCLGKC